MRRSSSERPGAARAAFAGLRVRRFDQDIARLDVAVDQALLVGVVQRLGHLRHQRRRLAERQAPVLKQVPRRLPVDEVRDDHRQPVQRGHLVDRDDPRMAELGRGARLALEAAQLLGLGQQPGVRDLQGDEAVQLRIAGRPHGPEGAHPHPLQELKAAQHAQDVHPRRVAGVAQPEQAAAGRAVYVGRLRPGQEHGMVAARAPRRQRLPGSYRHRFRTMGAASDHCMSQNREPEGEGK